MAQPVTIHVIWEGPLSEREVEQLSKLRRDRGLYQIYGFHPVYGPRDFEDLLADAQHRHVYVGRLAGTNFPGPGEWTDQIDAAEKLLIFAHIPAYNSQNIAASLDSGVAHVRLLNWGNYGSLLPEMSGQRWCDPRPKLKQYDAMSDDNAS